MAKTKHLVIGLMSGTSLDGVDAALLETDGEAWIAPRAFVTRPYAEAERRAIEEAIHVAQRLGRPGLDAAIGAAGRVLTRAHAQAIALLPGAEAAELIGFPGQTLLHRPPGSGAAHPFTWQIGDAALLARATGRPVVHDFRSADVAAGGEGAPLAPGYHRARLAGHRGPVAVLNIGGVANLSWFADPADKAAPFGGMDTGPGNGLLDDWVWRHGGVRFDRDGRIAARGVVHEDIVARLVDRAGGAGAAGRAGQVGPRSYDRNEFDASALGALTLEDGAATLAAFTAAMVAACLGALPVPLRHIHATGGGRLNPVLLRMIAQRTGAEVAPVEALGWNGDALEAECFGWLAVRHVRGLPLSFPETTGVAHPMTGGRLVRPS